MIEIIKKKKLKKRIQIFFKDGIGEKSGTK